MLHHDQLAFSCPKQEPQVPTNERLDLGRQVMMMIIMNKKFGENQLKQNNLFFKVNKNLNI